MIQRPLDAEFRRLREGHPAATRARVAALVLGPSVIRVFRAGTKPHLRDALERLPIDDLASMKRGEFPRWYERQLSKIARSVARLNGDNTRVLPGLKWGHSAKVLSLYLRDMVFHTRYFTDAEVERIGPWLPVPVDGIVIQRLTKLGLRLPFKAIREIDSARKSNEVQSILAAAAGRAGVPCVWFDDNWAQRQ